MELESKYWAMASNTSRKPYSKRWEGITIPVNLLVRHYTDTTFESYSYEFLLSTYRHSISAQKFH